jgi:uncharacterized protein YjiS (DUF1127 family)
LTRRITSRLRDAWAAFLAYRIERETVRMLQSLDNRTLKDIGLHRSEIESLAHNPASERRIGIDAHTVKRLPHLGMCA